LGRWASPSHFAQSGVATITINYLKVFLNKWVFFIPKTLRKLEAKVNIMVAKESLIFEIIVVYISQASTLQFLGAQM
jgi:hypothetical protein